MKKVKTIRVFKKTFYSRSFSEALREASEFSEKLLTAGVPPECVKYVSFDTTEILENKALTVIYFFHREIE